MKANVGDIITVSVDHVTKKGDGSWGWYAPKVKEVRDDKKEPDLVSVLQKISELSGSENTDAAQSQSSDVKEGKADKPSDADKEENKLENPDSSQPGKTLPLSEMHLS